MNAVFEDTSLPNIIQLENVRQKYGEVWAIDKADLLIEDLPNQGQFVAILGESGCGKTTLLRYIAGLRKPTEGTVKIRDVVQNGQIHIGMVFQRYSSFDWRTVEQNIAYPLDLRNAPKAEKDAIVTQLLADLNLTDQRYLYAQEGVLSGGQLQRVAIARTLAYNPDIFLMDEPFGALDTKTRKHMQDLLLSMWSKYQSTIIFVTHDVSEAVYLADEIWIMRARPGRISERININQTLGFERNQAITKTPQFSQMVSHLTELIEK